jgi:hypothetical protein
MLVPAVSVMLEAPVSFVIIQCPVVIQAGSPFSPFCKLEIRPNILPVSLNQGIDMLRSMNPEVIVLVLSPTIVMFDVVFEDMPECWYASTGAATTNASANEAAIAATAIPVLIVHGVNIEDIRAARKNYIRFFRNYLRFYRLLLCYLSCVKDLPYPEHK